MNVDEPLRSDVQGMAETLLLLLLGGGKEGERRMIDPGKDPAWWWQMILPVGNNPFIPGIPAHQNSSGAGGDWGDS